MTQQLKINITFYKNGVVKNGTHQTAHFYFFPPRKHIFFSPSYLFIIRF